MNDFGHCFFLGIGITIGVDITWGCVRLNGNLMIMGTRRWKAMGCFENSRVSLADSLNILWYSVREVSDSGSCGVGLRV